MKLLVLSDANSIHTQKWVFSLNNEGFNVHLFSLFKPNDEIAKLYINSGINVSTIDIKHRIRHIRNADISKLIYISSIPKLKQIIKSFSPQIIHAHYASSYGVLAYLLKFHPFILSFWGSDIYDFPQKNIFNKWIMKRVIKSADCICSTSMAMKKIIINDYNRKNVNLIPFGVDTNKFIPKIVKGNGFRIGTIKSIESHNGIDCLLDAASKLAKDKRYSEIQFDIIGKGSLLNQMKEKTKKLGIEKHVKFSGHISHENIEKHYQKLSIFVAVSTKESFGVSIVEAAACGVPAITSNVGGLPEVNNDNKTGFVIQPNDPQTLAELVIKLYNNEELRKELGVNARNMAIQKFDWKTSVQKMIKIYNQYI